MRKLFTHMIRATLLLFVVLAFFQVNAQRRYSPLVLTDFIYTIENDVQTTDRIYEFDLYLKDTDGGQPFELSIIQAGILCNMAILNGGTLTPSIVPASSELVTLQQPTNVLWSTGATNGCVKLTPKSGPGCGAGTIISSTGLGTKVCRIRLTNSVAFAQAQPNLTFTFTTSPYPTKVFQYSGSPCTSNQLTTDATNCVSHAVNPILNAVPTVVTSAATAVTTTTASLNGTINANSTTTTSSFEYGLDITYGTSVSGTPLTVTGTTVTDVTAAITSLLPNTTYHYRCVGTYGGSTIVNGLDMTFTTASPPPTMVTTTATAITSSGATLNGTANANGASTTVTFEYGLTIAYELTPVSGIPGTVTGTVETAVNAPITGLTPATLYHYRIKGVSSGGTTYGNDMTFTTDGNVPVLATVVTDAATNLTPTSAQLNGTVTANNTATTVTFEYGLTAAYGAPGSPINGIPVTVTGNTATAVFAIPSGLAPSTLYHFRCVGVNAAGTTNGLDMTFTTPAITLPTVVTNAASGLTPTGAQLNGTVTANGAATTVTFEYGLTASYGGPGSPITGIPATVNGNTPTSVMASLSGLLPSTTYHYRCVGVNSSGTAYGLDMTFTTPCPPAGQAGPITGPTQVCQGGTGYVYSVTIPYATGYIWTLPVGGTITSGLNTNTITVSYAENAVSGYVFVYGTSICGNGPPSQLGVAMNAPATPTLTGPVSACIGVPGNVYTTQTGMTNYVWNVSAGGTVTAGGTATSSSVTVTWTTTGAKTVSVNYNNANGCAGINPAVVNVTAHPLPVPTITGPTPACTNYPTLYSTETGMTNYSWTVTGGGTIVNGQGTPTVTVQWPTTGAKTVTVNYVNANGCAANTWTVKNVTVNTGANPTISGLTNICVNSGYITYTTETGMTGYNWTVSSGGVINFGQGTNAALVTWVTPGPQWVRVTYANSNGCSPPVPTQLDVTANPMPGDAGFISGTPELCGGAMGVSYSVDPISSAASYVWSLPSGATIVSGAGTNSIVVDFDLDAASGDITVYGNNVCGNGTISPAFEIMVTPTPPKPVITQVGDSLYSSAPEGNQWYFNGAPIADATDPYYLALESGEYYVVVTINGCSSEESDHIDLVVGIEDLGTSAFQLFPIPNDGRFSMTIYSPTQETYTISIYNAIGMKVREIRDVKVNGTVTQLIDLRPIAQGIYSVVLQNGKTHIEKKVVINK